MSEFNKNNEQDDNSQSQEAILRELQEKHAKQIMEAPGLLDRVVDAVKTHHPDRVFRGGKRPVVSRNRYDIIDSSGLQASGEALRIGIDRVDEGATTSPKVFATVAQRFQRPDGSVEVKPYQGFTNEDAELVAACVDELALAKFSDQIPDLSLRYLDISVFPDSPPDDLR